MYRLRPILKPYYEAMEEGKVLGMKCADCGDVTWPPLPTCQKCGGTNVDWVDMGKDAFVDEIRFEDPAIGGDYTFRKANDYFEDRTTPYTIMVGHWKGGTTQFHAALYGINADNLEAYNAKIPFPVKVKFIQMKKGFKSVGFECPPLEEL